MNRRAALVGGIFFAFGIVVACSSSDDATPTPDSSGSCGVLASRCHPYDGKTALAHECHELGHAGDDRKCGARRVECEAECPPTDAALPFEIVDGHVVRRDDAGIDSGADAGMDPCVTYCECQRATCRTQTNYPFASADCGKACALFSTEERDCWSKFCEHAKTLSEANRQHECQHSWGEFKLDECETL